MIWHVCRPCPISRLPASRLLRPLPTNAESTSKRYIHSIWALFFPLNTCLGFGRGAETPTPLLGAAAPRPPPDTLAYTLYATKRDAKVLKSKRGETLLNCTIGNVLIQLQLCSVKILKCPVEMHAVEQLFQLNRNAIDQTDRHLLYAQLALAIHKDPQLLHTLKESFDSDARFCHCLVKGLLHRRQVFTSLRNL